MKPASYPKTPAQSTATAPTTEAAPPSLDQIEIIARPLLGLDARARFRPLSYGARQTTFPSLSKRALIRPASVIIS
jgi:hypothetical protein